MDKIPFNRASEFTGVNRIQSTKKNKNLANMSSELTDTLNSSVKKIEFGLSKERDIESEVRTRLEKDDLDRLIDDSPYEKSVPYVVDFYIFLFHEEFNRLFEKYHRSVEQVSVYFETVNSDYTYNETFESGTDTFTFPALNDNFNTPITFTMPKSAKGILNVNHMNTYILPYADPRDIEPGVSKTSIVTSMVPIIHNPWFYIRSGQFSIPDSPLLIHYMPNKSGEFIGTQVGLSPCGIVDIFEVHQKIPKLTIESEIGLSGKMKFDVLDPDSDNSVKESLTVNFSLSYNVDTRSFTVSSSSRLINILPIIDSNGNCKIKAIFTGHVDNDTGIDLNGVFVNISSEITQINSNDYYVSICNMPRLNYFISTFIGRSKRITGERERVDNFLVGKEDIFDKFIDVSGYEDELRNVVESLSEKDYTFVK